jgi:hypothetical protein
MMHKRASTEKKMDRRVIAAPHDGCLLKKKKFTADTATGRTADNGPQRDDGKTIAKGGIRRKGRDFSYNPPAGKGTARSTLSCRHAAFLRNSFTL